MFNVRDRRFLYCKFFYYVHVFLNFQYTRVAFKLFNHLFYLINVIFFQIIKGLISGGIPVIFSTVNWLSFLIEIKSVPFLIEIKSVKKTPLFVKKGFTGCQNLLLLFKLLSAIFLKRSFFGSLQSLLHLVFCFFPVFKVFSRGPILMFLF